MSECVVICSGTGLAARETQKFKRRRTLGRNVVP